MSLDNPLLKQALEAHQSGQLTRAEEFYFLYLKQHDEDAQAWHLSGQVKFQQGLFLEAINCIQKAIERNGTSAQFYLSLGQSFEGAVEINKAYASYQQALKMRPDVFQVHYEYGCFLKNQKRNSEAIESFSKALSINPQHAPSCANLGSLYHQINQYSDAEKYCRKAVSLIPGTILQDDMRRHRSRALNNLAKVLQSQEKFEEAMVFSRKAMEGDKKFLPAHLTYGALCYALSAKAEAENIFRKILSVQADNVDALSMLAKCLIDKEEYLEAENLLKRSMALKPDDIGNCIHLGELLSKQNKLEQACQLYETGIKQHPDSARLQYALGVALGQRGNLENAREAYLAALRSDRYYLEALHALTKSTHYDDKEKPEVKLAIELLKEHEVNNNSVKDNNPLLSETNQQNLYFSLGKIFDELGEYDAAFKYYHLANQSVYSKNKYDIEEFKKYFEDTKQGFSSEFIKASGEYGLSNVKPVFILGMPRSGTTLLEQILSSHSQIMGAGELNTIQDIVKQLKLSFKTEQNTVQPTYPLNIDQISQDTITEFATEYVKKIESLTRDKSFQYVVDKNPVNFRHVGLIMTMFPQAKIIHTRRHPLDVVLSIYFQRFSSGHAYAFNLDALANYYQYYHKLMNLWCELYPDVIHSCRYDDLVLQTEKTSQQVTKYLNLDWEPGCLDFYKNKRKVETASFWQVRQPIYTGSLERWKHYQQPIASVREKLRKEIEDYQRVKRKKILGLF